MTKVTKPLAGVKHIDNFTYIELYIKGFNELSKLIIPSKMHIEDINLQCKNKLAQPKPNFPKEGM